MPAENRLIVALDVQTIAEANKLVSQLKDLVGMFKVGSQLFAVAGPDFVRRTIDAGNRVFLDLKFHDIPYQVAAAARHAAELGVSLFTVHASGGAEMMQRAVNSVSEVAQQKQTPRARIVAVTVLTSMDALTLTQIGINESPIDSATRLARLAEASGVDGVVSSPREASTIRSVTRPGFLIVTPGIRPASGLGENRYEDQKRVATPALALSAGADYLVIGRPITASPDPVTAAQGILDEIRSASENHTEQATAQNV